MQASDRCYRCGEHGHGRRECPWSPRLKQVPAAPRTPSGAEEEYRPSAGCPRCGRPDPSCGCSRNPIAEYAAAAAMARHMLGFGTADPSDTWVRTSFRERSGFRLLTDSALRTEARRQVAEFRSARDDAG